MFSNLKHRNFLVVLLIIFVISFSTGIGTTFTANAEENDTLTLTYTLLSDNTYSVTGYDTSSSAKAVVIPNTYNGKAVTVIGAGAFQNNKNITQVTIGDNVTTIEGNAFWSCTMLHNVTFGESVKTIGSYAFAQCKIYTLTFNSGLQEIEYSAFMNCDTLYSVFIPDSVVYIGNGAFYVDTRLYGDDKSEGVTFENTEGWYYTSTSGASSGTDLSSSDLANVFTAGEYLASTYWNYCWYNNIGALEFTLSSDGSYYTVTGIGSYKSASLVIPSTYKNLPVTAIGNSAFSGCTTITSVTIPDSVTTMGNYAFYNCTSLKTVTIPDSVTSLGAYVFRNCTALTSITIPDSVTDLGSYAFYNCTSLKTVTIGSGVNAIGNETFYKCTSLTSITIGESVTTIGNEAFAYCNSLKTVTIPDSVTSLGAYVFWNCTALTSITIPDSVTTIGNYTFYGCTTLKTVTIGSGVTEIGVDAFSGCSALTSVTLKKTSGWCVYEYSWSNVFVGYDDNDEEIWESQYVESSSGQSLANITNTSTAATYFKSTYVNCRWARTATDDEAPVGYFYTGSGGSGTNIADGSYYNGAIYFYATDNVAVTAVYYAIGSSTGTYTSVSADQYLISSTATEGTYYFYAKDAAGNQSSVYSITIDRTAPTITLYAGTSTITNGSYTNASYIYATASDSTSGISAIYIKEIDDELQILYAQLASLINKE